MGLLTYDWHPPDTSWVSSALQAAARDRLAQAEQQRTAAYQLAELGQRSQQSMAENLLRSQEMGNLQSFRQMQDAREQDRIGIEKQKSDYDYGGGSSGSGGTTPMPATSTPAEPDQPSLASSDSPTLPSPDSMGFSLVNPDGGLSDAIPMPGKGSSSTADDGSAYINTTPMGQPDESVPMPAGAASPAPSAPPPSSPSSLSLIPYDGGSMGQSLTQPDSRPISQRIGELTRAGMSRHDAATYIERTDTEKARIAAEARIASANIRANAQTQNRGAVDWSTGTPIIGGKPYKYDDQGELVPIGLGKGVTVRNTFQDEQGVPYTQMSDGSWLHDNEPAPGSKLTRIGLDKTPDPQKLAQSLLTQADAADKNTIQLQKSIKDAGAPQWPWQGDGNTTGEAGKYYGMGANGQRVELSKGDYDDAITKAQNIADTRAKITSLNTASTAARARALQLQGGTTPQPAAAAAAPMAPASGKVRVISPDGKPGSIPAANLPAALAAGYKQVQ